MKTMTCRQMAGPCDAEITGSTPEEMMQNGEKHIRELAEAGDEGHIAAVQMMEDASKNPEMGKVWFEEFMKTYNSLA